MGGWWAGWNKGEVTTRTELSLSAPPAPLRRGVWLADGGAEVVVEPVVAAAAAAAAVVVVVVLLRGQSDLLSLPA